MDFNLKLLGFSFKKISIDKKSDNFENFKVTTNISIPEIEKIDSNITKDDLLKISFKYSISYNPNLALIEFEGNLMFSSDSKSSKEILKQWKDKKIDEKLRVNLFNIILRRSNIKALNYEDEMGLPLHVPMPRITSQNQEKR